MADVVAGVEESVSCPQRPDSVEVQAKTRQLSTSIEKYAERIRELKELITQRRGERQQPTSEERALEKSFQETRGHLQKATKQKQLLNKAINEANAGHASLKAKVRQIKEHAANASSQGDIEIQIKRLEEKVNTTDLTVEEEKECIAKIRQLPDENFIDDLTEKLKDVDTKLEKCKAKEKESQNELEKMRKQREKQEMDISGWVSERDECWEILCALRAKKKEINDDFNAQMDAYRKEDKAYNDRRRTEEKQRRESERKARREAEKPPRVEELPKPEAKPKATPSRSFKAPSREETFAKEKEMRKEQRRLQKINQQRRQSQEKVDDCAELLKYLTQLIKPMVQTETVVEAATAVRESSSQAAMTDTGLRKYKKQDDERDAWLLGAKEKKSKHKRTKKAAKTEHPADKILMHSLQIYQAFQALDVSPPNTLADVPKAVETLKRHKCHHEALRDNPEAVQPTTPPKTEPKTSLNENPQSPPTTERSAEITTDRQLEESQESPEQQKTDTQAEPAPPPIDDDEPALVETPPDDAAPPSVTDDKPALVETPPDDAAPPSVTDDKPALVETLPSGAAPPPVEIQDEVINTEVASPREEAAAAVELPTDSDPIGHKEPETAAVEDVKSRLPSTLEDLDPLEDVEVIPKETTEIAVAIKDDVEFSQTVHCHFHTDNESQYVGLELEIVLGGVTDGIH